MTDLQKRVSTRLRQRTQPALFHKGWVGFLTVDAPSCYGWQEAKITMLLLSMKAPQTLSGRPVEQRPALPIAGACPSGSWCPVAVARSKPNKGRDEPLAVSAALGPAPGWGVTDGHTAGSPSESCSKLWAPGRGVFTPTSHSTASETISGCFRKLLT